MSTKYELQDILYVRNHRKEIAQEALFKAKQALVEAEEFLKKQQEKESDFIQKKPNFIKKIYEKALEKIQFKRNYLEIIHFKIGKLDEHQMKLAIETQKAQNTCEKARIRIQECAMAVAEAQQEMNKIEEHKKIWLEDMRRLDECIQDKELEDFKTKERHE